MLCIVKQPVVFKIDFKYKQSKNYHPEAHFAKCKYTDEESRQCNMLSDSVEDGFLETKEYMNRCIEDKLL